MVWWAYQNGTRIVFGPMEKKPNAGLEFHTFETEGTMAEEELRTRKTPHMIRHMIAELQTPKKELTWWENQFLESITDQFNRTSNLSDKQFVVLERIYAEKTA